VIVRWGLETLGPLLDELRIERPILITTKRWTDVAFLPVARTWDGVRPHSPRATVRQAVEAADGADGLVALGGGSAIDTAKAVSAETAMPVVSVPTTYSGAEWTTHFGVRDEERGVKGGGSGARLAGIVYDARLTLALPRSETAGTAMNALAHAAEALYVRDRNPAGDGHALAGARLVGKWLPRVVVDGRDLDARTELLVGAAEAGQALARSGLALGHAMAQALGGRYGLPHGALNAICLPTALRFNRIVAAEALARLGDALRGEPVAKAKELARLGGFERLRDLGVPESELGDVAEMAAVRGGARANPRAATPAEIADLYRSVW
jgi:alcohol dehydrogenase class IV